VGGTKTPRNKKNGWGERRRGGGKRGEKEGGNILARAFCLISINPDTRHLQ